MGSTEKCSQVFANAIIEKEKGTQFPFVIFHKPENTIIGSTRLMNIEAELKIFDTTIIHANAAVEFAISSKSN